MEKASKERKDRRNGGIKEGTKEGKKEGKKDGRKEGRIEALEDGRFPQYNIRDNCAI